MWTVEPPPSSLVSKLPWRNDRRDADLPLVRHAEDSLADEFRRSFSEESNALYNLKAK
jgi:hypothetical protein